MICSKYNHEEYSWLPSGAASNRLSRLLSDIISVPNFNPDLLDRFRVNFKIKVRDGSRVRFWEDKWCDSYCLKEEFPRLFSLSREKKGSLSMFSNLKETSGEWSILPRREFFEWEKLEMLRLASILDSGPTVSRGTVDHPRWAASSTGMFSVSSLYNLNTVEVGFIPRPINLIWNNVLLTKCNSLVGSRGGIRLRLRCSYKRLGFLRVVCPPCVTSVKIRRSQCFMCCYIAPLCGMFGLPY